MRALHQGTTGRRDAESAARARAHGRTRRRRGASRIEVLSEPVPVGAILAGGSGRRFGGTPKGLEVIGPRRIVDRVTAALRPVTSELVLLANDPAAVHWLPGVRVLADGYSGAGGLAGVETVLRAGRDAIVIAWDMPFVNAALVDILLREARAADADIALPESNSPHGFEPFCAFYAARVHPALEDFLQRGGGAARDFVARMDRVRRIPVGTTQRAGDPDVLFFSVNTPGDLQRARAIAANTQ